MKKFRNLSIIPPLANKSCRLSCQSFICFCLILSSCASSQKNVPRLSDNVVWTQNQPLVPKSVINLGGQSGLIYLNTDSNGTQFFMTLTDRGPNGELLKGGLRPFYYPRFAPQLMKLALTKDKKLSVVKRIILKDPHGKPLTGLPNIERDERPVDQQGKKLARDLGGIDCEGLTRDERGDWWLVEEYRPSILQFSSKGILKHRFIPKGSLSKKELAQLEKRWGKGVVRDNLPGLLNKRRPNRGFEGVTISHGILYAILQSPLVKGDLDIPLIEFDLNKLEVINLGYYQQDDNETEKIGDLTYSDGHFYVIEQNGKTGKKAIQNIVEIARTSSSTWKSLQKWSVSSFPEVAKLDKLEGIVRMPDGRFVLVNDNDFSLDATVLNHVIFVSP